VAHALGYTAVLVSSQGTIALADMVFLNRGQLWGSVAFWC